MASSKTKTCLDQGYAGRGAIRGILISRRVIHHLFDAMVYTLPTRPKMTNAIRTMVDQPLGLGLG